MTLARLDLTLTLLSPFVTGGDANPTFGLDAQLPRDAEGVPIIPGTLVRGVLRDALELLCQRGGGLVPGDPEITSGLIDAMFGRSSGTEKDDDGAGGAPRRGALAFSDFRATTARERSGTFTRIEIDERLGSVREGHLQVIELPWPVGAQVEFKGDIAARGGMHASLIERAVRAGLAVVPALGSAKSAGFGSLERFDVVRRPATSASPAAVRRNSKLAYRATLEFDGPFLVAAERAAPNVFAGSAYISGGALKGALADAWGVQEDATPEGSFLARTIFREAWPDLSQGKRPVTPPFSLAIYRSGSKGELRETIDEVAPAPRSISGSALAPCVFAIDWKDADSSAASGAFARLADRPSAEFVAQELDRQVRTRTAIDYAKGVADQGDGDGGSLFVYDLVAPSSRGRPVKWRFDIVLERDEDHPLLERIVNAQFLIGKNPTVGRITEIVPRADVATTAGALRKGHYALHLLTPALLTPLSRLRASGGDIEFAYLELLRAIFDCDVTMPRFFARQSLVGGWQAMRYPSRPSGGYEPWVLTEAGSIFWLVPPVGKEPEFKAALERVLLRGLPEQGVPQGAAWRASPFARTNGYGEVQVWNPRMIAAGFSEAAT